MFDLNEFILFDKVLRIYILQEISGTCNFVYISECNSVFSAFCEKYIRTSLRLHRHLTSYEMQSSKYQLA